MIKFVSPLPLMECVSHIRVLDERKGCLAVQSIQVDVVPDGDQSYWFLMRRWMYWNLAAELTGYLDFQSASSTSVSARARIATYPTIFYLMMIPFSLAFLVGILGNGDFREVPFLVLWLSILAFNWYRLNRWRDELLIMIQKALH